MVERRPCPLSLREREGPAATRWEGEGLRGQHRKPSPYPLPQGGGLHNTRLSRLSSASDESYPAFANRPSHNARISSIGIGLANR
jgi:hypothetical protein